MISDHNWLVVFGGAGREGTVERLVEVGVRILAVVVPEQGNEKLERAVQRIRQTGVLVVRVSRANLTEMLATWAGNGLISIGFPYLIAAETLALFQPALNVHPTLLPKYRGPTSGAYVLINGETESGSTVHHMSEHMDRGDVVAQSRVSIGPFDTVRSMQRKIYEREPDLLLEALNRYDRGLQPEKQNEALATEYPKRRSPGDSEINPRLPLIDLINEIRAADPNDFPAFFYHQGEKVCVRLWRPDKGDGIDDEI